MNGGNMFPILSLRFPANRSNQGFSPAVAAAIQPPAAEANQDLAWLLRRSLDGARGNPKIRERLQQLAQDADSVDAIVQILGSRHAVVRDLSHLLQRPESGPRA